MDGCRIGFGRVDITPDKPGPTMGWSSLGPKRAALPTEADQRLSVSALALEDSAGERVMLVNGDLHCGGLHLWRAAVDASGLDQSRVVMAGTHTHAGPGQRYGSLLYTLMAGPAPFAPWSSARRLAPLVQRAVRTAIESLRPGAAVVVRRVVPGAGSNRAVPAWDHYEHAVQSEFLELGPPSGLNGRAHLADRLRDPRVTVLVARSDDGSIDAAFAWYAVHGTALGVGWPAFGADLWGVARAEAEQDGASVGFAGGSSGDISPLPVDGDGRLRVSGADRPSAQGRELVESVGVRLGSAVRDAIADADVRTFSLQAAHELWDPRSSGLPGPMSGMATAGGGVDGPTKIWSGVAGGVRSPLYEARRRRAFPQADGQSPKISIVHAYTGLPLPIGWLFELLAPRRLPLHTVRIDDHTFATVPGEPTTMTGWRIEQAVRDASRSETASVIGFAGDYAGYWTTAEEYLEQRYEGASTIYGREASARLVERLTSMATALA
jgi:neutral ceramidase